MTCEELAKKLLETPELVVVFEIASANGDKEQREGLLIEKNYFQSDLSYLILEPRDQEGLFERVFDEEAAVKASISEIKNCYKEVKIPTPSEDYDPDEEV